MKISVGVFLVLMSSAVWALPEETPSVESGAQVVPPVVEEQELSEDEQYWAWAQGLWDSLEPQKGEVKISEAGAVLNVPESFYFLNQRDAQKVLVDVWGNPPGQDVLGMLFPEGMTPFDDGSWAVTVQYEEEGYVSDDNAADIDYGDLLDDMKADTKASSEYRVSEGFEPIELVGWAATPFYDAKAHKLHWAKEIKFGDQPTNTLNYNIRVLGRKGVLVLNFIADISSQPVIEENLDVVLSMAEFDQGSTYADFDPDLDQVAAYGLGALVAGKVIAKTGFIALALVFLKKFGVFIVIGLAALARGVFSKKKD